MVKMRFLENGRVAFVVGFGCAALLVLGALWATPLPKGLLGEPSQSVEFLDRKGFPLRAVLVDGEHYARVCRLSDVAPGFVSATLSAEDKRFRSHLGVDPLAILRASYGAVLGRKPASGASTITQQLVKIVRPKSRTWGNKIVEMWLAVRVECAWSKDRILGEYLNRLDYGNLQIGVASASRFYFSKPPGDLSPAEGAFLAGLPKAPSRLNPYRDFESAQARQRWVLHRENANGWLERDVFERALVEPIRLRARGRDFAAPHFVDFLLTRKGLSQRAGGVIRTTLDLDLNQFAEKCLDENLRNIADKHATGAAAVVLDNRTGEVLVLAGAGDYFQPGAGQINGAWMVRSPGSTMKPFTYLLALEKGLYPGSVVADVPSVFQTPTGLYRPNNYNHKFYGPVSLRFALGNSLNVAAVRVLEKAGGPEALQQTMRQLGITTFGHGSEHYGLGLTLGNGEVRLLELTNAFAALARLGKAQPFHLLLQEDNPVVEPRQVFDPGAAYLLADMLSDNGARAASFGLESFLAFDFPVACKTGTSSDYRDNWTLGYTPEFTVGVWVGNPDGSPMRAITGVTGAAPIFHELFEHLHERFGTSWFKAPPEVRDYAIDPLTGRLSPPARLGAVFEKGLASPLNSRPEDYDAMGRVVLPGEYEEWLGSFQNTLGSLVSKRIAVAELEIVQPQSGTVYYLDGDLPLTEQTIGLRARGVGGLDWECATALIVDGNGGKRLRLQEGRHGIKVRESVSGRESEVWIEVRAW